MRLLVPALQLPDSEDTAELDGWRRRVIVGIQVMCVA